MKFKNVYKIKSLYRFEIVFHDQGTGGSYNETFTTIAYNYGESFENIDEAVTEYQEKEDDPVLDIKSVERVSINNFVE